MGNADCVDTGRGRRILLVEDHADTALVMSRLLERMGFQITTADTLQAARARAGEEPFDLLICDIRLPDGSGLDLMREMKSNGGMKAIALSGLEADEDAGKSAEVGFQRHLTKPIDFKTLQQVVGEMMG
jgi:two-component system CheB/CheR fusion protein